jgi:hypothetical protein
MPLAFPSQSHGTIAFGFFNIETDLLLLEQLFFFADRFCQAIIDLSERKGESQSELRFDGFRIIDPFLIGNLHGAIQGIDLSGFIGATYQKFPFPSDPKGFKQKPYGAKNQEYMRDLILKYGKPAAIRIIWDQDSAKVSLDEYLFDQAVFTMLIAYVDQGGYPRWQDGIQPDFVHSMMKTLKKTSSPLLGA